MLVGNHRDAWGYGAADPSSGTAVMVEVARVLGELKKEGDTFLFEQKSSFAEIFTL